MNKTGKSKELEALPQERAVMQWVNDLQSACIQLLYCGHRYGSATSAASMADV
jgi:hypothetical protein